MTAGREAQIITCQATPSRFAGAVSGTFPQA